MRAQGTGRRARRRRAVGFASVTVLLLATGTATNPQRLTTGTATGPGPVPPYRSSALAPCMISGGMNVQMSEGIPTPPGYSAATGTLRALTLMIDFSDARGEGSAMDRYKEFFPKTANWFRTSSYGRLRYRSETPVKGWLRMPKPFRAYRIQRGAPFDPTYHKLVEDVVATADPKVDFRRYDLVNVLVTPNAGPSALDTVLSVTFAGNDDAPVADGVPVTDTSFVYSRQDDGSGSYDVTGYRVLPHENSHVFGLPDLYTQDGGSAVGHWDIMSEDWGADNDTLGWHKWKLGWLDPSQVSCVTTTGTAEYELTPLARRGGPKLIVLPLDAESGYVLELRAQEGNDALVCRPGVLLYQVKADVATGRGPVTVHDAHPHSGGCTHSPNVQAELSDATMTPGESFTDDRHGIHVTVVSQDDATGDVRVRVRRG